MLVVADMCTPTLAGVAPHFPRTCPGLPEPKQATSIDVRYVCIHVLSMCCCTAQEGSDMSFEETRADLLQRTLHDYGESELSLELLCTLLVLFAACA